MIEYLKYLSIFVAALNLRHLFDIEVAWFLFAFVVTVTSVLPRSPVGSLIFANCKTMLLSPRVITFLKMIYASVNRLLTSYTARVTYKKKSCEIEWVDNGIAYRVFLPYNRRIRSCRVKTEGKETRLPAGLRISMTVTDLGYEHVILTYDDESVKEFSGSDLIEA